MLTAAAFFITVFAAVPLPPAPLSLVSGFEAGDLSLDLKFETNLGPGTLNRGAMAALDAQIAQLRTLDPTSDPTDDRTDEGGGGTHKAYLPDEPDESALSSPTLGSCDLQVLSNSLTQALAKASDEVVIRWNALVELNDLTAQIGDDPGQDCALLTAKIYLLSAVSGRGSYACRPLERALRLADLAGQVPSDRQSHFAQELSLLADRQEAARQNQRPLSDLCGQYDRIEQDMRAAIYE